MSDEVTDEIRTRTDLVALIGEYVTLKRAGTQFKGLCPFHSEKSPSFHVHPDRQFFHCFGCQVSGDCFSFIQKLEGKTFPEAKRYLAERAGIELRPEDPQEELAHRQARLERERLLAVTEAAAGFYVRMLTEHPLGEMARAEIAKRGVSPEVAATYRLGYAPHGWDGLARLLASKGISPRDAELAGMIVPRKSGEGHYDRFRHRLMFPIADVHGKIVAFSGRVLPPPPGESEDPQGKYVNSPEGPLYKKSELLFGLHEARVELRREGTAILCEGNFDVLAIHQAGCKNVVAPLGTAFTAGQARLLRRYASKAVLVFDGDAAGRKATAAAYPLLMAEAITTRVAALPPGDDPDSYLRAKGAEALRSLLAKGVPIVEHLIESAAAAAGSDPAGRADAIESLGPVIQVVPTPIERDLWIERIAQIFQVADLDSVKQQLRRGIRAARGDRRGPAAAAPADPAPRRPSAPLPPVEKALVGLLLDQPELLGSSVVENVDTLLTSGDLRVILRIAARMVETRGAVDAQALLAEVGEIPARSWLEGRLSVQEFTDRKLAAHALEQEIVPRLRSDGLQRELAALKGEILRALRDGREDDANEMMRHQSTLLGQVAALQRARTAKG